MIGRNIVKEYANLLDNYPWEWYAILSFRQAVSVRKAWAIFNHWKIALKHKTGNSIHYFMAIDSDSWKHNPHFHVLLHGIGNEKGYKWQKSWYPIGIAKIKLYDPKLGAKYYLGKKFAGRIAEVKFSRKLPQAIFCGALPR